MLWFEFIELILVYIKIEDFRFWR